MSVQKYIRVIFAFQSSAKHVIVLAFFPKNRGRGLFKLEWHALWTVINKLHIVMFIFVPFCTPLWRIFRTFYVLTYRKKHLGNTGSWVIFFLITSFCFKTRGMKSWQNVLRVFFFILFTSSFFSTVERKYTAFVFYAFLFVIRVRERIKEHTNYNWSGREVKAKIRMPHSLRANFLYSSRNCRELFQFLLCKKHHRHWKIFSLWVFQIRFKKS